MLHSINGIVSASLGAWAVLGSATSPHSDVAVLERQNVGDRAGTQSGASRLSGRWSWTYADWAAVLPLAVGTIGLRLATHSTLLSHWDEVQYALGLHGFNVLLHHPHPPGSPFYILLGRASLALVGDDHQAFLLNAILASAGAVASIYVLTALLFNRRTAWVASAAFATQPVFWASGSSGSAWAMLPLLASLVGLCCLLLRRGARSLVVPSALAIGLASGFRLDVTVFMGPLWVWSLWRAEPRLARRLLAISLVVLSVATWLVPLALFSGGFRTWGNGLLRLFVSSSTGDPGAILKGLATSTLIEWGITVTTVGPFLVLALLSQRRRITEYLGTGEGREVLMLTLLWAIPSFLFLWFVDSTEAGHNLLYLVGLYPLAAGLALGLAPSWMRALATGATLVLVQTAVFLYASPRTAPPLAYVTDSILFNFTASALEEHDRAVTDAVTAIRASYDPSETVLVTLEPQTIYRFTMYYLPEYAVLRLGADGTRRGALRAIHRHHQWQPKGACLIDRSLTRAVWLVDAPSSPPTVPEAAIRRTTVADGSSSSLGIWELPLPPAGVQYRGYQLGGCDAD